MRKMKYVRPEAAWISFQVEEELSTDTNIASRPGTGTGTEIPPPVGGTGKSNADGSLNF